MKKPVYSKSHGESKYLMLISRLLVVIIIVSVFNPVSNAQNAKRKLKGTVKTTAGTPVRGAFIFIDRQINEKTTRSNGRFNLWVPVNADTIAIYTLDGRIVSGSISEREKIDLVMDTISTQPGFIYLNKKPEEVIDLGYFSSEVNKVTMSVDIVESKTIYKETYQNIYEMIKGEVPGVWVTRGNRDIVIRGKGSFYLSTSPLIVVDGVPTSSIEHIDPAAVESITVLKGAATTAYGARGSNGVLVIKMKKAVKK